MSQSYQNDGSLGTDALSVLAQIKDSVDRETIDINELIRSINRDVPTEDIAMMLGTRAKDYMDADEGHVLSRIILLMMGSEQRRSVMTEYGIQLVPMIINVSSPIDEEEIELQLNLNLADYVEKIFGPEFMEDVKYIATIPSVSIITKRWIISQFGQRYARRPAWVNVRQFDTNAFLSSDWKKHRTSKEISDIVKLLPDGVEEAYMYETDIPVEPPIDADEVYVIGDVGYGVEDSAMDVLRDRFATVPKRAISLRKGGIMQPSRAFGPLNSHLRDECDAGLDGCRMLTCTCEQVEVTNKCDMCNLNIRDRSWTVRYPDADGGWSGEYCSMLCMTSECVGNSRLSDLEEELKDTGICDRREI
jgi:hypothetical protein